MRFRLTYEGPLRSTQGEPKDGQRNPLAAHKHQIRRAFHGQLKHLWATDRFLKTAKTSAKAVALDMPDPGVIDLGNFSEERKPLSEAVAGLYQEYGYRFVPLVRENDRLLCTLRVLLLRRDQPGSIITSAGDIDNRIKTLIDGLRRPRNGAELVGNETPQEGEDPFFCLLEDDSQITHLEVETDVLHDPLEGNKIDQSHVRAVITVELRPYYVTLFNLSYV